MNTATKAPEATQQRILDHINRNMVDFPQTMKTLNEWLKAGGIAEDEMDQIRLSEEGSDLIVEISVPKRIYNILQEELKAVKA